MARTAAKSWQDDAILVEVNAVAQPDGTLLTGALFTFLSPSTRRGLTVSIGGGRVMRMQVPFGYSLDGQSDREGNQRHVTDLTKYNLYGTIQI
jgi:hypothetical protein